MLLTLKEKIKNLTIILATMMKKARRRAFINLKILETYALCMSNRKDGRTNQSLHFSLRVAAELYFHFKPWRKFKLIVIDLIHCDEIFHRKLCVLMFQGRESNHLFLRAKRPLRITLMVRSPSNTKVSSLCEYCFCLL